MPENSREQLERNDGVELGGDKVKTGIMGTRTLSSMVLCTALLAVSTMNRQTPRYEEKAITTKYDLSPEDKSRNDAVNATVATYKGSKKCTETIMVGPNMMCSEFVTPEVDRDSPVVKMLLPGKKEGENQVIIVREQTADNFWKIAEDCRKKTGILLMVNSAFRFNYVQDDLKKKLKNLASNAGYGRHAIDAVDISRYSANEKKKNPMTVDIHGNVIFLEDLETPEGKKRFGDVVARINAEEIEKFPNRKQRIIDEWTEEAQNDFDKNVWGAMDACMESFQKFNSSISQCGVISDPVNPNALRESWHAQPPREDMKNCKRWDKTYNANMLMYRKYPPISEDKYMELMNASYENAKKWFKKEWNDYWEQ